MLKKGEHIEGTPAELEQLLATEPAAKAFFEGLSKSYKQGYCDWVGLRQARRNAQSPSRKSPDHAQKQPENIENITPFFSCFT